MILTPKNTKTELATFAGGCFWCMVGPFKEQEGVLSVISGFAGGDVEKPTYEQVVQGNTGHREVVQVEFDPTKVPYESLLTIFWQQIDPTDALGQFADRGESYQTAIFYHSDAQRVAAEASKKKLEESKVFAQPVVTEILPYKNFYPADASHQDYHLKNPFHYSMYKKASGRQDFIDLHKEKIKNSIS